MYFKLPNSPAIPFRAAHDMQSESKPAPMPVKEKLARATMIRRSNLAPDLKAVALEMQMSCDGLNRSRLLNKALAALTDLPVETVDAAIAALQEKGLIRREMGGWTYISPENAWRAAGCFE